MKKSSMLIVLTAMFFFTACGQGKKNVPAEVKTALSTKFPNATNINWSKENAKEWEAEFKLSSKNYSANFDLSGNWIETEYKINISDIPTAVKTTLDKEYAGYKIEEPEISENAKGVTYEFALKKGKSEIEVAIDRSGKVINNKAEEKEDEENDDDD